MKPRFDASAARMSASSRTAAAGEVGTFREGVVRVRVAGPELRIAEPDEQIGAFGVGTMHGNRHVERDAVVVRRLGRCELFETPDRRRASTSAAPRRASRARACRASCTTTSGPMSSVRCSSERAACPCKRTRSDRPRSAYNALATSACTKRSDRRSRPGVDEETGARCAIERFDHDRLRKLDHVDEHVFGELDTEHRRRGQDARRVGTERADPAPHDVTQARRDILLARDRHVRRGDARIVQAARLDPVPDELRRVERVPGGLDPQRGGNPARFGTAGNRRDDGDQVGQLVVVESGELQATVLAPFEIGERGSQLLRRVLTGFAAARDNENRCVGQRVRDVTQHQQRRRLGPLEVVEHQHERPRRRDATEEIGRGLEHEESLGGVVGGRRIRSGRQLALRAVGRSAPARHRTA